MVALPGENRHDFPSTILDYRAAQSVGRRYARGVTHLDDAMYLWLRTLHLGKRGHPLESQGQRTEVVGLSTVWAAYKAHHLSKIRGVVGGRIGGCAGAELLLDLGHRCMVRKKPCQQLRMVIFLPAMRLSDLAYLLQFQGPPFFSPGRAGFWRRRGRPSTRRRADRNKSRLTYRAKRPPGAGWTLRYRDERIGNMGCVLLDSGYGFCNTIDAVLCCPALTSVPSIDFFY
jgi:hypothetical protein